MPVRADAISTIKSFHFNLTLLNPAAVEFQTSVNMTLSIAITYRSQHLESTCLGVYKICHRYSVFLKLL